MRLRALVFAYTVLVTPAASSVSAQNSPQSGSQSGSSENAQRAERPNAEKMRAMTPEEREKRAAGDGAPK